MRGVGDYVFKLLSAIVQLTELFSDTIWPSLSKVPPPLSKEGTKACIATCKRKMFPCKKEKDKEISTCPK